MRYPDSIVFVWLSSVQLCVRGVSCYKVELKMRADSCRKITHVEQQQFGFFGALPLSALLSSKCRYGLGYA